MFLPCKQYKFFSQENQCLLRHARVLRLSVLNVREQKKELGRREKLIRELISSLKREANGNEEA